MAVKRNADDTSDREIVSIRIFDAPQDLVFLAWSDPQHLAKWWGPRGFTLSNKSMQLKSDGHWNYTMHGPDGRDYANNISYLEVVKPEKLVYKHGGDDGNVDFFVKVTFEELNNSKTKLTMRAVFESVEELRRLDKEYGAIEGGVQTLDRLTEQLGTMAHPEEFVIARTFKASQELMFKAWSEPERMAKWFGPKGVKIEYKKFEMRPGGMNHYSMLTPDGNKMWGRAIYREIVKPEKLVWVNSFSDENGGLGRHPMAPTWPAEMLTTVTFNEANGRTTVLIRWLPINATAEELKMFEEGRQGMTMGWGGSLDQLAEYLTAAAGA